MPSKTNELALEQHIEKSLVGYCQEDLANGVHEPEENYGIGCGFEIADATNFNAQYALDEKIFFEFLESTQAEELEKIKSGVNWKLKIMEKFHRLVKKYGLLRLLKKGLGVDTAHLNLFYPAPMQSSSESVKQNFAENRFSVCRQVHYNIENPGEEIDMLIMVNGTPLATIELKNPWTHQTAANHGIRQYKYDRDPRQPLLQFGRCLVHFAVDTDEVYMTTKLQGAKTFFLPFNKGHNKGKGNPPNPFGHKTAYLWEEVFTPNSLANIIQHFVRFDGKATDPLNSKTLFFPRYHQLNVVRKIIKDVSQKGVGQRYLIQHSAGSGKSNSITWTAYQLIEVYPESESVRGAKGKDKPLFDSVIVVTDRRLLDKQLRNTIKEFSEVKNILAPAFSSRDLRDALEQGKKIIISTIQKFPFILDGISDMGDRNFAVIIDEAHSSQSGVSADKMNQAMGSNAETEDAEDAQDKILKAMKQRKMRGNASYFAFTATPKNATLEKFGSKQADGSFEVFDLYSMKQAIEEGFILDVLANYTTYKSYYEIEKSIQDNPLFETAKAQKKLRTFVERDKRTIATKSEIILDHFINKVYNTKKLKGKAKGMVITQNIESAIRYYLALNRLLEEKGKPFKIAIAFSGDKKVDGIEYTESEMNGFPEKDTKDKFDSDEYRILVVANKYLTGFDQPKLCCMYVDKKLQDVLAVQALSRLNRSANHLGKKTEDLFILDFFNQVEDIKKSFDQFYTATSLSKETDVGVLHELKISLDEAGVYEQDEIEEFIALYFNQAEAQLLSPLIDVAASRFNRELELSDDEKADFKIKAKQFVKVYGQMAALLPHEVIEWEKLFWFLKFLIPKLIVKTKEDEAIDELLESVDLSTYGLERTKLNHSIGLDDSDTEIDPQNPNPRGVNGGDEERDPLDEIIRTFNDRWFQGWEATPEDQRVKFISLTKHIQAHPDFELKVAQNQDIQNRDLAFKKILDDVMSKQRRNEMELYKLYAKDDAFYQAFLDTMKRMTKASGFRK